VPTFLKALGRYAGPAQSSRFVRVPSPCLSGPALDLHDDL